MPLTPSPLVIAALDAGSNAIRAVVARASSATEIRELASARWAVRLGHNVFTRKRLDPRTMSRAVEAFLHFRSLLNRGGGHQRDARGGEPRCPDLAHLSRGRD
jgi:exopolyphosphatase/pppGpp-phosphohydrolase